MKHTKWIFMLVLILFPTSVSAEFYRYIDKDGKVRFTDNLANVPVDQRPQVEEYSPVSYPSAPEKDLETQKEEVDHEEITREPTEIPSQGEPLAKGGEDDTAEQQLKQIGAKLRKEYEALIKEKQQLEKEAKAPLTPAAHKKLTEKISDFNARIKDYERRKQAFNEEVRDYNARIREKD